VKGCAYPLIVPGALCLLGLLAAVANIRKVLPMLIVCLSVALALPVGLMGSVMFALDVPLQVACKEKQAQLHRAPGVFQWYALPRCDAGPIAALSHLLHNSSVTLAHDACAQLRTSCDGDPTFNATALPFLCNATALVRCSSSEQVAHIADRMLLKVGAPGCGVNGHNGCSLSSCALDCHNKTMRGYAQRVQLLQQYMASVASAQTDVLQPWADCNTFWDHILSFVPVCGRMAAGVRLIGAGCGLCVMTMLVGVVTMFLGTKRFFSTNGLARTSSNQDAVVVDGGVFIAPMHMTEHKIQAIEAYAQYVAEVDEPHPGQYEPPQHQPAAPPAPVMRVEPQPAATMNDLQAQLDAMLPTFDQPPNPMPDTFVVPDFEPLQ
jgi:hypothetical protein